jgi:DNA processing protein
MSGDACDACLRRTWLVAALGPHLDIAWKRRRDLRDVLALPDALLLEALAGSDRDRLQAGWEAFAPEEARGRCARAGVVAVCPHSPRYPARLRTGPGEPAVLHVAGGLERLEARVGGGDTDAVPTVSVVGTRHASAEGLEMARALGRGLARAGVTVVSGMALGIDSAAHVGALSAPGPTLAVLAGGADVPYPPSKAALHARIRGEHCVVSELPPGYRPFRWCFPARNRIIAALGQMTVVVEGAERSGSLITADFAAALGREVAAVPGRVTSPRTRGSNGLLRDGATVVLDVGDVLDAVFGAERPADGAGSAARPGAAPGAAAVAGAAGAGVDLPAELATVLDAVAGGRDRLDALARTPAEADAAMVALAELELRGLVRRAPGGRYVAAVDAYPSPA